MCQGCLIHIDVQDVSHFDHLIHSNAFSSFVLFIAPFGWQNLHWIFPLFAFVFSNEVLGFFLEILSFGFSQVSFELSVYRAVDPSLL